MGNLTDRLFSPVEKKKKENDRHRAKKLITPFSFQSLPTVKIQEIGVGVDTFEKNQTTTFFD